MPQVEQEPSVCGKQMNDDGDLLSYCGFLIASIYVQRQSATIQVAHIQLRKLHFGLIRHGLSTTKFSKRECKRMGKVYFGIRSFAYRIPHPHAAAASRLRLPRIMES